LIGFNLSSNLLLGFNFHFLNAVNPAAARPITATTTMMAISVVLLIPPIWVDDVSDAVVADDEGPAVLVTDVTLGSDECTTTIVDCATEEARGIVVGPTWAVSGVVGAALEGAKIGVSTCTCLSCALQLTCRVYGRRRWCSVRIIGN
jgi:hypothetical protein